MGKHAHSSLQYAVLVATYPVQLVRKLVKLRIRQLMWFHVKRDVETTLLELRILKRFDMGAEPRSAYFCDGKLSKSEICLDGLVVFRTAVASKVADSKSKEYALWYLVDIVHRCLCG